MLSNSLCRIIVSFQTKTMHVLVGQKYTEYNRTVIRNGIASENLYYVFSTLKYIFSAWLMEWFH